MTRGTSHLVVPKQASDKVLQKVKGAGEENNLIMYAVISNIKFKKFIKNFIKGGTYEA
jgi:hypothetical protein